MSPRSEEFMASAQERIRAAHAALAAGFPSVAVSAGYYDARDVSDDEGRALVLGTERFVAVVAAMLGSAGER